MIRLAPLLGVLLLSACAARSPRFPGPLAVVGRGEVDLRAPVSPAPARPAPRRERPPEDDFASTLVASAEYYLRHRPARDDCSGYVCAVFTRAGLPLAGSSASLWEDARAAGVDHRRKVPEVGDLAFFDDTYDRNRNGRWDDPLSHVAVVLGVEPDGTITLAHGGIGKGRSTMVMNLRRPDVHEDEAGKELNSWLRQARRGDPRSARYLSGELWRGFASLRPPETVARDLGRDGVAETSEPR